MCQRLLRRHVPAGAVGGRLAVDKNITELVRQLAVFGGAEEVAGRPGTGVQHEHDGRFRLQLGGDVYEHLDAGRVVAKVLHLRERGPLDELPVLLAEGGGLDTGKGHQACHQPGKPHFGCWCCERVRD
jgi:hypothetical protein